MPKDTWKLSRRRSSAQKYQSSHNLERFPSVLADNSVSNQENYDPLIGCSVSSLPKKLEVTSEKLSIAEESLKRRHLQDVSSRRALRRKDRLVEEEKEAMHEVLMRSEAENRVLTNELDSLSHVNTLLDKAKSRNSTLCKENKALKNKVSRAPAQKIKATYREGSGEGSREC
jgi:hypothetical protein